MLVFSVTVYWCLFRVYCESLCVVILSLWHLFKCIDQENNEFKKKRQRNRRLMHNTGYISTLQMALKVFRRLKMSKCQYIWYKISDQTELMLKYNSISMSLKPFGDKTIYVLFRMRTKSIFFLVVRWCCS